MLLFAENMIIIWLTRIICKKVYTTSYKWEKNVTLKVSITKANVTAFYIKTNGKAIFIPYLIKNNIKPTHTIGIYNYLSWSISYEHNNDLRNKLSRLQGICGILRTLKYKTKKNLPHKFCKTMVIPILMYRYVT